MVPVPPPTPQPQVVCTYSSHLLRCRVRAVQPSTIPHLRLVYGRIMCGPRFLLFAPITASVRARPYRKVLSVLFFLVLNANSCELSTYQMHLLCCCVRAVQPSTIPHLRLVYGRIMCGPRFLLFAPMTSSVQTGFVLSPWGLLGAWGLRGGCGDYGDYGGCGG